VKLAVLQLVHSRQVTVCACAQSDQHWEEQRPLGSGAVSHPDEARNEAALAILSDPSPRAWRLVDAFEREFLSGHFTERTIDAGAVEHWVRRRERNSRG
jgi:hypothetical protein